MDSSLPPIRSVTDEIPDFESFNVRTRRRRRAGRGSEYTTMDGQGMYGGGWGYQGNAMRGFDPSFSQYPGPGSMFPNTWGYPPYQGGFFG